MFQRHETVLADTNRIRQFFDICERKDFFASAQITRDEQNFPWAVVERSGYAVGVPLLGPGRWYTNESREHWKTEYAHRVESLRSRTTTEQDAELSAVVAGLRFGALSARLMLFIHSELIRQKQSFVRIPDTFARHAIWGHRAPSHWRGELRKLMTSLSRIHIHDEVGEGSLARFGDATSLITHFKVPGRQESQNCFGECAFAGKPIHSHILVNVGLGFAGILEEMAFGNPNGGIRRYKFPNPSNNKSQLAENEKALKKIGKSGRVTSIFLPAVLGHPDQVKLLSSTQKHLFQTIFRERTRHRKKAKHAIAETETFVGRMVKPVGPDTKGHPAPMIPCPFLSADTEYVGFNGNRILKGRGYRVSTWAERGDYNDVASLVVDFKALAQHLNIVVACIDPSNSQWISLEELEVMSDLQPSAAGRLHLRVYSKSDYSERWSTFFGWRSSDESNNGCLLHQVRIIVKQSPHPQSYFARLLEIDPSVFSKMLRGLRPIPKSMLTRMSNLIPERELDSATPPNYPI